MNKKIPRKGYRTLAALWTLAALSMAAAVVRQMPGFSVPTLCLLAVSVIAAAGFWRTYIKYDSSNKNQTNQEDKNND